MRNALGQVVFLSHVERVLAVSNPIQDRQGRQLAWTLDP